MADDLTPEDAELESLLARALAGADPVPANLRAGALDAFAFRDLDAALAALVEFETSAVRDAAPGLLVFATEEIEISLDVSGRRTTGQIAPAGAWRARLEALGHEPVPIEVDERGQFAVELPSGPVRVVADDGQRSVRTDWFTA